MLSTMLIPPLRTPLEFDLKESLASWLDETAQKCGFVSVQVEHDLERISHLRTRLVEAGNDHQKASLQDYQEYHASLVQCEERGFPSAETSTSARYFSFPWKDETQQQVERSNFQWEQCNVLWNIASLLSYQASIQQKRDRTGWNQAHLLLQEASCVLHHLLQHVDNTSSSSFENVHFWKAFLLAQGQVATYYMALASAKPRHVVLSKLAFAALPLLTEASASALSLENCALHSKAWSMWMMALAQYHESCVHRQKKQWDLELARLQKARHAIMTCQDVVFSPNNNSGTVAKGMEMLQGEVPKMVRTIRDRLVEAQDVFEGRPPSPSTTVLREIRGELLVKPNLPLPRHLVTLEQPLFQDIHEIDDASLHQQQESLSDSQRAIQKFQYELHKMVQDLSRLSLDKMEEARLALAEANLPHSLTAYKQEVSNATSGIPMDLWERMEALQEDELLSSLRRDLWELRERAELSTALAKAISKQLEDDLELDQRFRRDHAHFEGHVATEVQRSFRSCLKNYQGLLQKARNGDEELKKRLESLDTDPKYKLLQFSKSQLDRLLPPPGESDDTDDQYHKLARLLVALSSLFDERQELLDKLELQADKYDIASIMADIDPSSPTATQEYERVVEMSFKTFGGMTYNVRTNIARQGEMVESILAENEHFVQARDATVSANANENCITMIEDAIEEAEQLRKHLEEGRDFYDGVIGKLQHLQHEAGVASVRLTVERCEFEDRSRHRHQEHDDARLAASLAARPPSTRSIEQTETTRTENADDASRSSSQQLDSGGVVVDDSKVAHLVAMDFPPDKVVEALKKHNNNIDQAIGYLLSG